MSKYEYIDEELKTPEIIKDQNAVIAMLFVIIPLSTIILSWLGFILYEDDIFFPPFKWYVFTICLSSLLMYVFNMFISSELGVRLRQLLLKSSLEFLNKEEKEKQEEIKRLEQLEIQKLFKKQAKEIKKTQKKQKSYETRFKKDVMKLTEIKFKDKLADQLSDRLMEKFEDKLTDHLSDRLMKKFNL